MGTAIEGVDFNKLEKEFAEAVEADKKYKRENAAKFRAVEQRVGSYDEFRNIVLASNLQPLDRKDIEGGNTKPQVLNSACQPSNRNGHIGDNTSEFHEDETARRFPDNADSFVKEWKRFSKTNPMRYKQILRLNQDNIGKILPSELVGNLLGEIVVALNECFDTKCALRVATALKYLSMNKRFSLSLQFLNKNEKAATKDLLDKLTASLSECSNSTVTELRCNYNI